jgi:hypothetical protein
VQILFTILFVLLSMHSAAFFQFQVDNMWCFYLAIVGAFAV